MAKINPSSLCTKFQKSIDGWILPIPTVEDGKYKIRCFMNRTSKTNYDGEYILEFKDIYTYICPSFEDMVKFYMFQSFGQAYNGFLKNIQTRTSFQNENDHIQGRFLVEKVLKSNFLGESAMICGKIQEKFDEIGFEFSTEPISEKDRKSVGEILKEINKMVI